jgi:hypothetical protein
MSAQIKFTRNKVVPFFIEIFRGYMSYLREVGCNQGLVSSMVVLLPEPFTKNILQVKTYNNKQVFSEHALIVLTNFCYSVDEKKFKLKVELLTNFENPDSNPLQIL